MDRILFIFPPHISYEAFVNPAFNERTMLKKSKEYGSVITDIPLGILSLSAYLKENAAVDVKFIDFNVVLNKMDSFEHSSFSDLFDHVLSGKDWLDYAPTIIGISALFTPAYQNMLDLASVARRKFSDSVIVAGGGVPTNMYADILSDDKYFDALCYGEGEKPFLELVTSGNKIDVIQQHPSWMTAEKIRKGVEFKHDFITDLDEIPFLDYGILDRDDYGVSSMLSLFPLAPKKKGLPVLTSRGCPHRCCFCASHTVHGRKMRYHSLARVEEDFRRLQAAYGVEMVIFQDDHLLGDVGRFLKIVDIMRAAGLIGFFPNSLALYKLDRKVLEALQGIGVNHLVLSVESGSDHVLKDIMHKPLDLSIVERVISDCRDLEISTDLSILIGLPGETKQDIEDAAAFFRTIHPTWFRISMATPLVGSEMHQICVENDYMRGDSLKCDFKKAIIETKDFDPEYIQKKSYEMNLDLNFVHNSDFRLGNFETALKGFENTIKVRNDHAFAYYFAAQCCQKLGLEQKFSNYGQRYQHIIENSGFWNDYACQFNLVPFITAEIL